MKDWAKFSVKPDDTILKVLETLNLSALQFVVVTNENKQLLGTVTDGDIRRGLLKGIQLTDAIDKVMNQHPRTLPINSSRKELRSKFKEKGINHIPLVDEQNRIIEIVLLSEISKAEAKENNVILMAGGLGSRLASLTQNCPKPMLKVGDKPILERILNQFTEQGFVNFHFSVNYMAEMIENHFSDGEEFECHINYLREDKKLGTAGPLSLLSENIDKPVIVMNGDLLTHIDFEELLDFHYKNKANVTMCVREYDFQVPFGVIEIDDVYAQSFKEKPSFNFKVNAGIYVINPDMIKRIPKNDYYDMSAFLNGLLADNKKIACFPIVKGWIDVGREDDLRIAQEQYSK